MRVAGGERSEPASAALLQYGDFGDSVGISAFFGFSEAILVIFSDFMSHSYFTYMKITVVIFVYVK